MKFKLLTYTITGILTLGLFGCSQKTETQIERSPNQVLTVGDYYEPSSLDPGTWGTMEESLIGLNLFEGLLRVGKDGNPEPGMAKKWDISNDQLTYTFHLRIDAKWSDGKPVTANDFEFSWLRVLNPETGSGTAYMMEPIKNAAAYNIGEAKKEDVGIKALDTHTLQVKLEQPTPYFLGLVSSFTFSPVREDVIKKVPKTWSTKAQLLVSNGPFHVTNWEHKYKIEAEVNPHYWDQKNIKLSQLILRFDGTTNGQWADFQDGNIDIGTSIPYTVNLEEEINKGDIISHPIQGTQFFQFNTTRKPFDDLRVRKALALVIDKEKIVENRGFGENAAGGIIPIGMPDYDSNTDFRKIGGEVQPVKRTEAHIEEAKRLLAEAGYPNGESFPVVNYLGSNSLVPILEDGFSKLGIKINAPELPDSVYQEKLANNDFDLNDSNWFADFSDPINFLAPFTAYDFISINQEFYEHIDKSYILTDPKKRFEALHEAEKSLLESYAVVPYVYNVDIYSIQKHVKGFVRTARTEPLYRLAYIDEELKKKESDK